jgi:hypothetical protein
MIVKIINPESGLQEWCLLDFQGELVGKLPGNELGNMKVTGDSVELEVGSYHLEGQVVTLKQPYLIIQKEREKVNKLESTDYDMVGIVYKKIHFKTRPKPKPIYPK